jgi:acyl phosphate:glycerol-3-phosphate acyltransferase
MHTILLSVAVGYLLGSIPFGYLLVRAFRGADIRSSGSGNIGATNVARTSRGLGWLTLLLDMAKGAAAVWIALTILSGSRTDAFAAACAAICGHVFPIWLGFRGGKGVATALGSFVLLTPKAVLLALGIFLAVVLLFRYVSLASISAAIAVPVFAYFFSPAHPAAQLALISCASGLIVLKHHQNIRRLVTGLEPKFRLTH